MLSKSILKKVFKLPTNKVLQSSNILPLSTSSTILRQNEELNERSEKLQKPVKDWGNKEDKPDERRKPLKPKEPLFAIFRIFRSDIEFTPWGIKKYLDIKYVGKKKIIQSFNPIRHKVLGPDLSFAHFLIYAGGKVKFKGIDKWITLNEDKRTVDLPNNFDPSYVLTEFDASDIELYYEALENFRNVPTVKRAIFTKSPLFDDWYVDKISSLFPFLEYLDISDCPRVSERGLEALYRSANLKTLIITNNYKSAAFELTCMMLEDCIPELKIEILEPKEIVTPYINTNIIA